VEEVQLGIARDSDFPAQVSQSVIPPVPSETQYGGPKPFEVVPIKKQFLFIGFPRIKHHLTYCLIYKTNQKPRMFYSNGKLNFSYDRDISSFKITVPNKLFSTICSGNSMEDWLTIEIAIVDFSDYQIPVTQLVEVRKGNYTIFLGY